MKLLLITTTEGTVTGFGLANPELFGEREATRQILTGQPTSQPAPGSVIVTDKGLGGRETEEFFTGLDFTLLRPARQGREDPPPPPRLATPTRPSDHLDADKPLGLERHNARVRAGLRARVLQRLLALNTTIWHN